MFYLFKQFLSVFSVVRVFQLVSQFVLVFIMFHMLFSKQACLHGFELQECDRQMRLEKSYPTHKSTSQTDFRSLSYCLLFIYLVFVALSEG